MKRIIGLFIKIVVSFYGQWNVARLCRKDYFIYAVSFERGNVFKRALRKRHLAPAVLCQKLFFNTAGVGTYPYRNVGMNQRFGDFLNVFFGADIAGIDPDFIHSGVNRFKRVFIIKMDIGDKRNRDSFFDFAQRFHVVVIFNGHSDNVATQNFQFGNLPYNIVDF